MKVKELIEKLSVFNQEAELLLSSDEELNVIYSDVEAQYYENKTKIVLWGNSGSEVEE